MEFFPMDDVGQSHLQYPSIGSAPLSSTSYPTSGNLISPTFASNFGYITSTLPPSGYLVSHRKTTDARQGNVLDYALQTSGIDIRGSPPFTPVTSRTSFTNNGVIKLSNIPFTVTAAEIKQFFSRNSQYTFPAEDHSQELVIHIIMEKPTGKTMDCFVEFPSQFAAHQCVHMSSQAELMEAIFPRARLVNFDDNTGQPTISQPNGSQGWSQGFRGFVTIEEIHGVVKFAESPGRSPFVLKAHQRVYECMISTLYKFPWAATDLYTIAARDALFVATYNQIYILAGKINPIKSSTGHYTSHSALSSSSSSSNDGRSPTGEREVGLNHKLLQDLIRAAVSVPAFTILQKTAFCTVAGSHGSTFPLSSFREAWPFQTLEPVGGVHDNIVRFWLEIFDTGFHIMDGEGIQTGFEEYLIFTRTHEGFGFPIAEWTIAGSELTFDEAVRTEIAVVRQYIDCGLQNWKRERRLQFDSMYNQDPMNVPVHVQNRNTSRVAESLNPQSIVSRKYDNKTNFLTTDEEDLSPKSSRDLGGCLIPQTSSSTFTDGISQSSTPSSGGHHRFNVATAIDFVPSSSRSQTSSDSRPTYNTPMKLTLDTSFTRPAAPTAITLKQHNQSFVSEVQSKYQTPTHAQRLSSSAIDPGPLSNIFSTPTSHTSGSKQSNVRSHPRSHTYSSGVPDSLTSSFDNFSFTSPSRSAQPDISPAKRSQTQPNVAMREPRDEFPDALVLGVDNPPSDVLRGAVMRSLEKESKSRSQMGALGQAQSPSRADFGPIGSARPSISEGSQTPAPAVPAPIMPIIPATHVGSNQADRSQSIPQDRRVREGNDGRLSAGELWSTISPGIKRPQ